MADCVKGSSRSPQFWCFSQGTPRAQHVCLIALVAIMKGPRVVSTENRHGVASQEGKWCSGTGQEALWIFRLFREHSIAPSLPSCPFISGMVQDRSSPLGTVASVVRLLQEVCVQEESWKVGQAHSQAHGPWGQHQVLSVLGASPDCFWHNLPWGIAVILKSQEIPTPLLSLKVVSLGSFASRFIVLAHNI